MKRKLIILTLLGVFLFSSTGFPITVHICSVNGLSPTTACKMHKEVKKEHSCCTTEEESPIKITVNQFEGCCQFKTIDKSLTDQYVISSNDINIKSSVKSLLTDIVSSYQSPAFSDYFSFSSSTSPPATGNHLYLNISVLLI